MGIRSKAKKIRQLLPVVGAGGNVRNTVTEEPTPAPQAAPSPKPNLAPPAPSNPRGDKSPTEYIEEVVKSNTVVLFMKGSPAQPQCGFSATAAGILQSYGVDIHHVDILRDPEVRQGIKDYSNWPTLPQVYVGGEFLGGSDILRQMHEQGELEDAIAEASSSE